MARGEPARSPRLSWPWCMRCGVRLHAAGVFAVLCLGASPPPRSFFDRYRGLAWTVIGFFAGLIGIVIILAAEIVRRRRAEKALVRERDMAQRYLDTADVMFVVIDTEGRVELINRKGCEILGYSEDGIVGRDWFRSFLPERRADPVRDIFRQLLAGEIDSVECYENPVVTRSGEERMIAWHNVLLREKNAVVGTLSSGEDITERKRAEEALRESEQRFRSIVENSPMGVFVCRLDNENRLVLESSNSAADQVTGTDNSALIGKPIEEAFPSLAGTEDLARFRRAAAYGEYWHTDGLEYADERINGAFEVHAFQSSPGRVTVLFADVTNRKRAEDELRRYRDSLEDIVLERTRALEEAHSDLLASERMATLGRLTATVAHEMRNPLGTIAGSLFTVGELTRAAGLERAERALARAERAVRRCDGIIEELLDYTRARELNLRPVELDAWLGDILDELDVPDGVRLRRRLDAPGSVLISADHFLRCVINVVNNACQAMEGGPGRLEVTSRIAGDRAEVVIADNGRGIPPDVMEHIFEPLFSTKGFGVGLGMAVVQQVMGLHRGGVDVRSEVGEGTVVTLWLPRA